MIFKLFIDKNCQEEIIANVHAGAPLINEIERLVLQDNISDQLPGYVEDEIVMLDIESIECFAAGVSVVYQIESLPKAFAGLIQAAVLYVDYLGIYLLNGWIPANKIWIFTVIFVLALAIIWFIIYIPIKIKVDKMNKIMSKQ